MRRGATGFVGEGEGTEEGREGVMVRGAEALEALSKGGVARAAKVELVAPTGESFETKTTRRPVCSSTNLEQAAKSSTPFSLK